MASAFRAFQAQLDGHSPFAHWSESMCIDSFEINFGARRTFGRSAEPWYRFPVTRCIQSVWKRNIIYSYELYWNGFHKSSLLEDDQLCVGCGISARDMGVVDFMYRLLTVKFSRNCVYNVNMNNIELWSTKINMTTIAYRDRDVYC